MRVFLLTLIAICASGCVSIKPVVFDATKAASLSGRSLTVSFRQRPPFLAVTGAKQVLIGGALGIAAMTSAGNEIVNENSIKDPSRTIARRLANAMAQKYGVVIAPKVALIDTDNRDDLVKLGPDLVLDVMTIGWQFRYFPGNWSHYQVGFSTRAILMDSKSGVVLAEGVCNGVPTTDANAPTYDELLNDGAARLKKTLYDDGDHCTSEFMSKTFSL